MNLGPEKLALFDFDETLIEENSLGLLFKQVTGKKFLFPDVLPLILDFKTYLNGIKNSIKKTLYKKNLKGVTESQLYQAGFNSAVGLTPKINVLKQLNILASKRIHIWIITATPTEFVKGYVQAMEWPVDDVIGTDLHKKDGIYTGTFTSECMGNEKVKRIEAAFKSFSHNPRIVEAYGNYPVDLPMLDLSETKYLVYPNRIEKLMK